jgi:glycopeptide antibiotics resistance protein
MKRRLLSILILIAFSAILIKIMVFKDLPTIRIGQLMLNFGGTDGGHSANFIPFTTIVPYLLGFKGWIIAGVNLVGNIALLVPIGFLVPFVYRNITWKKSLALGVAAGLVIEVMQTVLRVGIFDIDDVILNTLGVMIGYWIFIILAKWMRERKYIHILIASIMSLAIVASGFYAIYPHGQPVIYPEARTGDLCGGTGGNGQVVSVGNNSFTIKRKDGVRQIINLTGQATIKTSAGPASISALKTGDKVTLVGDGNPDGSFTAHTVLICNS